MKTLILALVLSLVACGSVQRQEASQTVSAQEATVVSTQDETAAQGASVDGNVESVVTENIEGIPTHWFIIGALVFGMIIPQPKFIRAVF